MEKAAWKSFKNVTTNFLGNHKAESCCYMVADLVQSLQSCEVYYAVRGIFLRLSLRQLPINSQGSERFHIDIFTIKKRYQGEWSPSMLADYCLALVRYIAQAKYCRKSSTLTSCVMYIPSVI